MHNFEIGFICNVQAAAFPFTTPAAVDWQPNSVLGGKSVYRATWAAKATADARTNSRARSKPVQHHHLTQIRA